VTLGRDDENNRFVGELSIGESPTKDVDYVKQFEEQSKDNDDHDVFNLSRILQAQKSTYYTALKEIKNGRKYSHWMWYIFPQIDGLGYSEITKKYAIKNIKEAAAYLKHDILGSRLIELSTALLELGTNNANEVFGYPDYLKLKSSMTLFSQVNEAPIIFQEVLNKFFSGEPDEKTLKILRSDMQL